MKKPLIIGVGNPLREDDGMGPRALQLVCGKLAPGTADMLECYQLTPELAAPLAESALTVLLDAAVDQPPGSVRTRRVDPGELRTWSHQLSPSELLGLAQAVSRRTIPVFLVSGGVFHTGFTAALTPAAEECAKRMAALAAEIVLGSDSRAC
jgi:hydrogenase maturation protease